MFAVELYAGIRRAVMVNGLSRRGAVWRSSQHDFKDAAVFCPAGLSAAGATGVQEARSLHGLDRHASRTAMPLEDLGKLAGGRDGAAAGLSAARASLPLASLLMRPAGIVAGAEQRVGC